MSGPGDATLPCAAPRGIGARTGPCRPPIGDVFLQVEHPEFYFRETIVTIFDNIFESLVRRCHPESMTRTGRSKPAPTRGEGGRARPGGPVDGLAHVFDP